MSDVPPPCSPNIKDEVGGVLVATSPSPTPPPTTGSGSGSGAHENTVAGHAGAVAVAPASSGPSSANLTPHPTHTHTHTHPNPFATPLDLSCPHYARLGSGRPYGYYISPTILAHAARAAALCAAFNDTAGRPAAKAEGAAAIRALLGEVGEGAGALPPLQVSFGTHVRLGRGVWLGPGAVFQDHGGVTIGDNTLIGPQLTIVTVHHPLSASRRTAACPERCEPVFIGADAWLGARVTVLPGVRIGDRCVVGAGSVVTKSTGEGELWVGVPARCVRVLGEDEERGKVDWDDMPQERGPEVG